MDKGVLIFIACVFNICCSAAGLEDSVNCKRSFHLPSVISYSNNISASYFHYKNWQYNGINSYSFLLRSTINYDTTGKRLEAHLRLNAELGYMKFTDSSWNKSTDYVDLSADVVK